MLPPFWLFKIALVREGKKLCAAAASSRHTSFPWPWGKGNSPLIYEIYKCFFLPWENLDYLSTFSLGGKFSIVIRLFLSKGKGNFIEFFPLLSSDFSVINPKTTMLCQPFANRFRCYSEIFRQLIHCYPSIHIAGIESSFYAACSILFSLGWGLFAAEVSPERRVFRIKIAIRLYILQHAGIIYPMHGVIEPKIDRSELRELMCNWISVTKNLTGGGAVLIFEKWDSGVGGGMCKKPLCYIRAFTTPLLRPSLFARVCVGSGG